VSAATPSLPESHGPADALAAAGEGLAASFPGLMAQAERVAQTVAQGVHGRRRPGQGDSFWQYRNFDQGDSSLSVDWRRSARSDTLYVRETEWEAAQSVYLWADRSASMRYASGRGRPTKAERAALIAMAAGFLLDHAGERFALMDGAMRPGIGRPALARLAEGLARAPDPAEPGLPLSQALPRHAQAIWIGDFLEPLDGLAARLGPLSERQVHGILVQVLDPAEESLPFAGRVRFDGMEGEGSYLATRVEALRTPYRAALAAHKKGLGEITRRAGWLHLIHRTDTGPEQALMALFMALGNGADRIRGRVGR